MLDTLTYTTELPEQTPVPDQLKILHFSTLLMGRS